MILRSNIGANVQDAKMASFLWFRHYISYFPPAYAECGACILLLGGRGGEGICAIDMFWAPHSALYILQWKHFN